MPDEIRGQGEDLVVVFRAPDEFIADIVKGLLVGEGIPVVLESRQVAQMDGVMKMGEGYWGDVVVPRAYAARARELIEAYQTGDQTESEQG
jgi:hypothetical protein